MDETNSIRAIGGGAQAKRRPPQLRQVSQIEHHAENPPRGLSTAATDAQGSDARPAEPGHTDAQDASGGRVTTSTGVAKLDRVLGGGIRDRDRVLLYGPSFQGKEVLARRCYMASLQAGRPAIMILTNRGVDEVRRDLLQMDDRFPEYEAKGLAWFVDAYSRSIGIDGSEANVEFVDSASDVNNISIALNRVHGQIVDDHPEHLMVMDSASTLVLYGNAQATFRFLQVLIGRGRQAGATSVILLDQGMHADAEVQMFRHLADGTVEMRSDGDKNQLRIEGLGIEQNPGWVDFETRGHVLDITGSMAAGRIR